MTRPAVMDTSREWHRDAVDTIAALAETGVVLTSDDLRRVMRPAPSPAQVGTAFREAHRLGIIRPAGYKESNTPSRRHGVIRVWRGKQES